MRNSWNRGIDVIFRGAPCAIVVSVAPSSSMYAALGSTDGAIALANMEMAAPSLGLATCWCGFLMLAAQQYEPLKKEFNGHAVVGAVRDPPHIGIWLTPTAGGRRAASAVSAMRAPQACAGDLEELDEQKKKFRARGQ
eukprot:TRINITY_DN2618_c0_g1_i7.p1 TRINITY_DN2618_c0_g1~~TRINITY_DN2618_c0_g1_i7.p1  ORF type:complete len:138 (+),score=14.03 TRINITY_DN2618_c0_g1_i7:516-929(+)